MRLLYDQNLSPRLVDRLIDLFPDSRHVSTVGLEAATDDEVWTFARDNGLVIVSKDGDFGEMNVLRGFPPKVIWLRLGNCTTRHVENALRANHPAIEARGADPDSGTLAIS